VLLVVQQCPKPCCGQWAKTLPCAVPKPCWLQEDYVELDGVRIDKPFVEKPASGEDHNVHIYYPHSMVGGCWGGG